jgi:hypothetical protein
MSIPSDLINRARATLEGLGRAPRTVPPDVLHTLKMPRAASARTRGLVCTFFGFLAVGIVLAARFLPSYDQWEGPQFWICLITFIGLSYLGIWLLLDARKIRACCLRVLTLGEGTLGRITRIQIQGGQAVTSLALRVSFFDAGGKQHSMKGQWPVLMQKSDLAPFAVGAPIVVLYDCTHPEQAAVFPMDYEGAGMIHWITSSPAAQPAPVAEPPIDRGLEAVRRAWEAHQQELQDIPGGERRGQMLMIWRQAIDEEAHDLADLILGHPRRDDIMRLEVSTMMDAYLMGHMARRGWIGEIDARLASHRVGRAFRDQLRQWGVPIDTCRATLGMVVNDALERIAELGIREDP